MRILMATAELRPLVSVGGLGEAATGLAMALRRAGHEVDVVLPDYAGWELEDEAPIEITVPPWAAPTTVRRGVHPAVGPVVLVDSLEIRRADPYVDPEGIGWEDNDLRFAAFSAAVAALVGPLGADVIQLNDWHTGLVPAFTGPGRPTVLTIHNLAHQGWANVGWLYELPAHREAYRRHNAVNMLAGAIRVVDTVATVSPTYAQEITTEEGGMGLDDLLRARAGDLVGIRNGIDTAVWDPAADPLIPVPYGPGRLDGKLAARARLLEQAGWPETREPLVGLVTRLVEQKGVDLAFEAARYLEGMRARLVILGSGDRGLADWGRWLAREHPDRVWFRDGFDLALAHLIFAGADLFVMPSKFEPCGLAQMQAMAYGTIPVVTGVGGLCDTVTDADAQRAGTGFVASTVDTAGLVDALHRALIAFRHHGRRRGIITRGMATDWSWDGPAAEFAALYQGLVERYRPSPDQVPADQAAGAPAS
jgi:starch synthase